MATPSRSLAWRIPQTEEPSGLQSIASQRVGHDRATSLSLFTVIGTHVRTVFQKRLQPCSDLRTWSFASRDPTWISLRAQSCVRSSTHTSFATVSQKFGGPQRASALHLFETLDALKNSQKPGKSHKCVSCNPQSACLRCKDWRRSMLA